MTSATYDLNELKRRMQGAVQVFRQELEACVPAGRSAGLLDTFRRRPTDPYAAQSAGDRQRARAPSVTVQVWDKSLVHAVEKRSRRQSRTYTVDRRQTLRLRIPELTKSDARSSPNCA